MKSVKPFLFLLLALLPGVHQAQETAPFPIAADRQLWHGYVDQEQQRLLQGAAQVQLDRDPLVNQQIFRALIARVDQLQQSVESDSLMTSNNKKRCLRNLQVMIRQYLDHIDRGLAQPALASELMPAFEACLKLDLQGKSIEPVFIEHSYEAGSILVECFQFPTENPGLPAARIELTRKYCGLHPEEILMVLNENPRLPFTDSLIGIAARGNLSRLYDFAQSANALGDRIRNHPDTLVRLIAQMANNKSGRLYFPFLDNILRGRLTLEEIDRVKDDELAYFRLLVQTRMDYAQRQLPPRLDTARESKALTAMMTRKAREVFVNEINALHAERNEQVRFRRLDNLTPEELYYLAVLGDDQLYTSSFVRGIYPRIFQRMNPARSDSLLLRVHADYFRKFIKLCAAYNTLNDFLGRMDDNNTILLMKAFSYGLEKIEGIEEAVDVADSYSSLRDKNQALALLIRNEVVANYHKNRIAGNKKGIAVYQILQLLFESSAPAQQTDLSASLGISSIYAVDYADLSDDSGRIVMQVFFYGDEDQDGQHSFASFMGIFRRNPNWKIEENSEWVSISSVKGRPLLIFANKPLFGDDDPEERAINNLDAHLNRLRYKPSIYVHRGHSYHVQSTMKRIAPSARIVILGSCGGYNNINEVLSISEEAHIISSKQTGTMFVNDPILQAISTQLLAGKGINWMSLWKGLSSRLSTPAAREKFDDYIPPYKNLGALFIKAYQKALANDPELY